MIRIQRRRAQGWRLPEGAVIVDRTSRWGNPFIVGEHRVDTRADAVRLFLLLLDGYVCVSAGPPISVQIEYQRHFRRNAWRLRKATALACWCPIDAVCHADALRHLAVLNDRHASVTADYISAVAELRLLGERVRVPLKANGAAA